jgi:hypothetical protein
LSRRIAVAGRGRRRSVRSGVRRSILD